MHFIDMEILSIKNLEISCQEAGLNSEREHVTPYLWKNDDRFKIKKLELDKDYKFLRLTVDELVDFEVVKMVIEQLYPIKGAAFNFEDILGLYQDNPGLFRRNEHIVRNEGYLKSLQKD